VPRRRARWARHWSPSRAPRWCQAAGRRRQQRISEGF
jgi:hypothetical protein